MPIQRNIVIYTDGASRGNPGMSASGYMICEGKEVLVRHSMCVGISTNNRAEYGAVIAALEWCAKHLDASALHIKLYSDSTVVVKQINGLFKTKSPELRKLCSRVRGLAACFGFVKFDNVPRGDKGIGTVDASLNELLDECGKGKK